MLNIHFGQNDYNRFAVYIGLMLREIEIKSSTISTDTHDFTISLIIDIR